MKTFHTGTAYIRTVARQAGLIADSDNDDVLIQRVTQLIKAAEPDLIKHVVRNFTKAGDKVQPAAPSEAGGSSSGQQP